MGDLGYIGAPSGAVRIVSWSGLSEGRLNPWMSATPARSDLDLVMLVREGKRGRILSCWTIYCLETFFRRSRMSVRSARPSKRRPVTRRADASAAVGMSKRTSSIARS